MTNRLTRAGVAAAVAAFTVATSPAFASDPASSREQPRQATDAQPAARPNVRYCVDMEPVTGSRIVRRECHTRAEWLQLGFDPATAPRKH